MVVVSALAKASPKMSSACARVSRLYHQHFPPAIPLEPQKRPQSSETPRQLDADENTGIQFPQPDECDRLSDNPAGTSSIQFPQPGECERLSGFLVKNGTTGKLEENDVAKSQKENVQREAREERPCARAADAAGNMKNWSNSMSPV